MTKAKNYWIVTREYAGLAEAGGVKSVVTSLAKGFQNLSWDVTVFIPLYGCTALSNVEDFDVIERISCEIIIDSKPHRIVYASGYFKGIKIIFIVNSIFTSKMGVYTYTRLEEALNPEQKSGEGHLDSNEVSILFQKAAIQFGLEVGEKPDVFHCQDAHTSLIPYLVQKNAQAKEFYKHSKFFITIHNAGTVYRDQCKSIEHASKLLGIPQSDFENYSINGKPEPFLLSSNFATLTTVSPWYAKELLDPKNEFCSDISTEFYKRNCSIIGITNGIDFEHYTPLVKQVSKLPYTFNPSKGKLKGKYQCRKTFLRKYTVVHTCKDEKKVDRVFQYGILKETRKKRGQDEPVYFSFHGRLVHQKGIDVLVDAAREVLRTCSNARFIVMGHGTKDFELLNQEIAKEFYGKYIYFKGYDKSLSRLCIAVSDFLVLPSFFEPCGLQDFIGQLYGTIPVAHASGGLQKIIHNKTGFLYSQNDAKTLASLLIDLVNKKNNDTNAFYDMISYSSAYIQEQYSWNKIINDHYIPLFS